MEIIVNELNLVAIEQIVKNYEEETSIVFDGELDCNPDYTREYFYEGHNEESVINSIIKFGFIGAVYINKIDGHYEIIDGKQRILSICRFVSNKFSIKIDEKRLYFKDLSEELKNKILNTKIHVRVDEISRQKAEETFVSYNKKY